MVRQMILNATRETRETATRPHCPRTLLPQVRWTGWPRPPAIRLGISGETPAAFFTCSSSLVDGFRADFGDVLSYQGNRAVLLDEPFPEELDICFVRALTYHRAKRNL